MGTDWVLRGGRVICPTSGIDELLDLKIENGSIAAMEPPGVLPRGDHDVELGGELVVPGLIDAHVHTAQPLSSYGVCADRWGIESGVCHVNDMAGTSWLSTHVIREYEKTVRTPMSATIYVAGVGNPENWAIGHPELLRASLDEGMLEAAILRHRDFYTSIKVHLDVGFLEMIKEEPLRPYRVARRVSQRLGIPLYMHLGLLGPTDGSLDDRYEGYLDEVISSLSCGDIIGHVLTPWPGSPTGTDLRCWNRLLSREDVFFEIGHGVNMCFARGRKWLETGLPLLTSSDGHRQTGHMGRLQSDRRLVHQDSELASWTLVGTMSKLLGLGFDLIEVIRSATATPALALNRADTMGRLAVGRRADITVLEERTGSFQFVDNVGETLNTNYMLAPKMTILKGEAWDLTPDELPEFRAELGMKAWPKQPAKVSPHKGARSAAAGDTGAGRSGDSEARSLPQWQPGPPAPSR